MAFKLSKNDINLLKNDDITKFPNNAAKIITYKKYKNKKFLIINLSKLNDNIYYTNVDFLDLLLSYEEANWKFLGSLYPYVYFYKHNKVSFFKKIFKKS